MRLIIFFIFIVVCYISPLQANPHDNFVGMWECYFDETDKLARQKIRWRFHPNSTFTETIFWQDDRQQQLHGHFSLNERMLTLDYVINTTNTTTALKPSNYIYYFRFLNQDFLVVRAAVCPQNQPCEWVFHRKMEF